MNSDTPHHDLEDYYENDDENTPKASSTDELVQIFIGGLAPQVSENVLRDYFGQYGELAECRLVVDKHSSKSRGFGFVAFQDPDCTQAVLEQKHYLIGKEVECKAALSKHDSNQRVSDEKSKKIFVGGIPLYVTEDELKAYFRKFGDIKTCRIIYRHESNISRGFGFVVFKHKHSADEVIIRKDEHFIHGKWIDCKSAILRQEIEQDPLLAAQLAAKKEARRSPSPNKGSPPKVKKSSPQRVVDHEAMDPIPKEKMPKYAPQSYKQPDYSYEGQDLDYPYDYQGVKQSPYFSPSSYQWNNRYYEQQTYPRSSRHNPQRENQRYREHQPPPREYPQPMMSHPRVSPTNRYVYQQQAFPFGYYPGPEIPQMMPQPIYNPVPAYQQPSTSYRPPSPMKMHPDPMPVPVIQDFSPPQRERYITDFNEDYEDQLDYHRQVRPKLPLQTSPVDQAIKLNLVNLKTEQLEESFPAKAPLETSKTLSPDRKPYHLFDGSKEPEIYDRPTGVMSRHTGMIGARVAEVNSSRNSPRLIEYKKYYSPTQKHRGEVVSKLFEKAITLKPQQTDKTTEKFTK